MSKPKRLRRKQGLAPVHPHAAAIDIGATVHVAAVGPDRDPEPVRSFGTFTADLHRLADWFERCGVRTVAMESTGVYWIPVYEVLEQRGFAVVLVNAQGKRMIEFYSPTGPAFGRHSSNERGSLRLVRSHPT